MRSITAPVGLILAGIVLAANQATAQEETSARPSLEEKFQALNLADARKWEMFLDSAYQKKAGLLQSPVFVWTNPTKNKGQHGAIFVWTHAGRPMVIGSIF